MKELSFYIDKHVIRYSKWHEGKILFSRAFLIKDIQEIYLHYEESNILLDILFYCEARNLVIPLKNNSLVIDGEIRTAQELFTDIIQALSNHYEHQS